MFFEEPKMEILTFAKEDLVVASDSCNQDCIELGCTTVCKGNTCTTGVYCSSYRDI